MLIPQRFGEKMPQLHDILAVVTKILLMDVSMRSIMISKARFARQQAHVRP